MPSIYLADVIGTGAFEDPHRPSWPEGTGFAVLMIDEVRRRALVASPVDTVTGTGIERLLTGPSWEELRANGKKNNPTPAARTKFNNWLTTAGYQPLTAAQVTWYDCVMYAARQVNPDANLDTVQASRLAQ